MRMGNDYDDMNNADEIKIRKYGWKKIIEINAETQMKNAKLIKIINEKEINKKKNGR